MVISDWTRDTCLCPYRTNPRWVGAKGRRRQLFSSAFSADAVAGAKTLSFLGFLGKERALDRESGP